MRVPRLTLDDLRARFAERPAALLDMVEDIAARLSRSGEPGGLPTPMAADDLRAAARTLLTDAPDPASRPLWGVPYAVSDSIDVAGLPSMAGVPGLAYVADCDADLVGRLKAAGALLVGKTGLASPDLTTASPDTGTAIVNGLVAFTVGISALDHAAGTVVSVRPSPGDISTAGIFAFAPHLDRLDIDAADLGTASAVRVVTSGHRAGRPAGALPAPLRVGVVKADRPTSAQLDLRGWSTVGIEGAIFSELPGWLRDGPWAAERLVELETVIAEVPDVFEAVIGARLGRARAMSAVEVFRAYERLGLVQRRLAAAAATFDVLLAPAALPLSACGWASVAVPVTDRESPAALAWFGPAGSDDTLAEIATLFASSPSPAMATTPLASPHP